MKKILIGTTVLVIILCGCGSANYFPEKKTLKQKKIEARETKNENFIQLNDGTIISYSDLTYKVSNGYLYGDGKKLDYRFDSIRMFQTNKFCVVRYESTVKLQNGNDKKSSLKLERIIKGKINAFVGSEYQNNLYNSASTSGVFINESSNQKATRAGGNVRVYYLQKGDNGEIIRFSKQGLRSMVADNKSLKDKDYFNEIMKKSKFELKNIIDVLEEYN
ncbi:MAG: hypothetical protein KA319_08960 [Ferruginibacter sp.]|nr:hypothetical protein [Ferruginibacter sp.]